MKWNEVEGSKKLPLFSIIFLIGFLIRMVDPISVIFCAVYILFAHKLYTKEERPEALGLKKPASNKEYLISFLEVALFIALLLPMYLLSRYGFVHLFDPMITMAYNALGNVWLVALVFWLAIGTFSVYAEEVFFRGYMQDAMDDMLEVDTTDPKALTRKKLLSLTICSLLFGISHLNLLWADIYLWGVVRPDAIFIVSGVITIAFIGFLLGIVRIKTDSLYPALLAHTVGNFFMILIPALILYG